MIDFENNKGRLILYRLKGRPYLADKNADVWDSEKKEFKWLEGKVFGVVNTTSYKSDDIVLSSYLIEDTTTKVVNPYSCDEYEIKFQTQEERSHGKGFFGNKAKI